MDVLGNFSIVVPFARPNLWAITEVAIRDGARLARCSCDWTTGNTAIFVEQPFSGPNTVLWYLLTYYADHTKSGNRGYSEYHREKEELKQRLRAVGGSSVGNVTVSTSSTLFEYDNYQIFLFQKLDALKEAVQLYLCWNAQPKGEKRTERTNCAGGCTGGYCGGAWFNDAGNRVAITQPA
jgi:hypothetical protein